MRFPVSFASYRQRCHVSLRQRSCLCGFLVVTVTLAWGCCGTHSVFIESPETQSLINANNTFALDLYQRLENQGGNLIFSPFCAYTSLGMTYAGARGRTELEMAKVLHFSLPQQEIHPAFHELLSRLEELRHGNAINITMANSLWPQKGYPLKAAFVELIRTNYNVDVHPMDFSKAIVAARQINDWTEQKTDGIIKGMITADQINRLNSRLFLCSAIYFNGKWQTKFLPKNTTSSSFYTSVGKTVTAPMMSQFSKFKVTSSATFGGNNVLQLLELPYSDRNLSMIILLPAELGNMTALEHELTLSNLNVWLARLDQMPARRVHISLPRFAFGHTFDLIDVLKHIGLVSIFGPEANLSGMDGTTNLYVAGAVHSAVIDVNEAGTKAAAAAWVHTDRKSMPQSFRADHPFIFLIRDNATGCILFMGRVVNPLE